MSKVIKGVSIVIKRVYNEISLKTGSNENWPSPCRKVLFCIHYLVTNQANIFWPILVVFIIHGAIVAIIYNYLCN